MASRKRSINRRHRYGATVVDERNFDDLTRVLAKGGSRRNALKTLLSLAGIGLSLGAGSTAEAARRGYGGPKVPDSESNEVCFGYYCGERTSSLQCPCPSADWCVNGACVLSCDPSRGRSCGDCVNCSCRLNAAQTAYSCISPIPTARICTQDADCLSGSYCSSDGSCRYPCCSKY